MLGQSSMLADKGYRGDTLVPNTIVVGDHLDQRICAYRLVVERFFGRLKNTFIVFSRRWTLDIDSFSDFFDVACGLTNLTILVDPLNHGDWVFNNNILLMWVNEIQENEENRRMKEAARRERRRLEREELILNILRTVVIIEFTIHTNHFRSFKNQFYFWNYFNSPVESFNRS